MIDIKHYINNKIVLITISYFIFLLACAFFLSNEAGDYNLFLATTSEIFKYSHLGDPKYFITAAIDIAHNGWITTANEWILNLWPPGFILLEALIIKLFGVNAPIIAILQVLASFLFSIVSLLLFQFLKKYINNYVAYFLPMIVFIFPMSRVFLLGQIGVSLGETFSIGFFLIFMLLSIRATTNKSILLAVSAGIFLGLSAYFRSYFETILIFVTLWGIIVIIFILVKNNQNQKSFFLIKTIIIILVVSNMTTIPWRIYHLVYQDSAKWVFTADLMFQNQVSSSDKFVGSGGFILVGGGNTACKIDPSVCGKVENAKELVVRTYINNPIKWYSFKFESIDKYWYASIKNWVTVGVKAKPFDIFSNAVILIMLILLNYFFLDRKMRSDKVTVLFAWFNLSLLSVYSVIFTIAHFEVRYFYFPKIAIIYLFLIITTVYIKIKLNVIKEKKE